MVVASDSPAQSTADLSDMGIGPGVLFDRLLDAVVIARLSTGRIVQWNGAAEKLFGYRADEVIGKSIEILMPEPIARLHQIGFERYLRTGRGLIIDARGPVEMPARTRGGEEIRVELALSELQNAQGERFALAVIRDATLRKQVELTNLELVQARVARSEAEAAVSERDQLLECVAASLENHPTDAELERLVDALADIRRLQQGQVKVRPVDGDVVDLMHAACDAARRRMVGRRLLIHTPPSVPASFDPARLRQVFDQVLDELIRLSRDGAHIEARVEALSPQLVQVRLQADGVGEARPASIGLQLSRLLMQQQGGTLSSLHSSSGSLEVVMTLPGSPHPMRRRPGRSRRPGPAASANSR
jgi:PAS domain S-box-containing protein